jgi:flagellar motor protein MotB
MKNKLVSFVLTFSIVFTTMLVLTACGEQSKQTPVAEAIIIQNTANSKIPNLASPELEKMITEATSSDGFISVVNLDGNPQLVNEWLIKLPQSGLSKSQLDKIAVQQAQGVLSSLATVKAKSDEINIISAIQIAERSLEDSPKGSSKRIIIFSTGLSTSGILAFEKSDFIDSSSDAVANYLSQQQAIPNLQKIQIEWYNLGDNASPQVALSGAQKSNLKQIWTKIIELGGGQVTFSDTLPGADAPAKDYPTVSTVSLLNTPTATFDGKGPVAFTDKNIRFIGNSADYVDPTAAKAALTPIVDFMELNPNFNAFLVGTTASGNKAFCEQLSSERANAVKNTLIALGIPANRIKTLGVGYSNIWHVPDTNPDGTLNEVVAAQNRAVILLDEASTQAQSILAENN